MVSFYRQIFSNDDFLYSMKYLFETFFMNVSVLSIFIVLALLSFVIFLFVKVL